MVKIAGRKVLYRRMKIKCGGNEIKTNAAYFDVFRHGRVILSAIQVLVQPIGCFEIKVLTFHQFRVIFQ